MAQFILGEQEARDQINQFCAWYGIDLARKTSRADDEGIIGFQLTVDMLIDAVRRGRLEVQTREHPKGGDTLIVVQHLAHPLSNGAITEITYHEVTGATKASVKVGKNATETAALWTALGVVSREGPEIFHALRGEDIGVAQLFGFLFLQI